MVMIMKQLGLKSYEYISGEGESPKLNLVWPENMSEDGKTAIEQVSVPDK